MAVLWVLTLLLALFVQTQASAPCTCGSVLRIKKTAMEYAAQTQRRPLQEAFQMLHFTNIPSGGGGFLGGGGGFLGGGILGEVGNIAGGILKIAGIDIKKVQLPEMKVTLRPGFGVQVVVDTGFDIVLRAVLVGGIELKVGAGVTADLQISKTSRGRPLLKIAACKSIIGELNFIVGGNELIPNFVKIIRNHIHGFLADNMCLTVSTVFLGLNPHLELFGAQEQINDQFGLQYTMPDPPVVTQEYMDMGMNVDYQIKDEHIKDLSVTSTSLKLPPNAGSSDSMVNMGFSVEYFASLFLAMQSTGGFNVDVSSQTVSSAEAQLLTTYTLGGIIPEVRRRYPTALPIRILITLSRAPVVTLAPGKIVLRLTPAVEISVVIPGSSLQSLLVLDVDLLLAAQLGVSNGKLKLSLTKESAVQLSLVSSNVGSCKVSTTTATIIDTYNQESKCHASDLSGYINGYFEKFFMIHVNSELSFGVSLPSLPNVNLIKPVTDIQKEYAVVSCDLQVRE